MKTKYEIVDETSMFAIVNKIQALLCKSGIILAIVLVILQFFHYLSFNKRFPYTAYSLGGGIGTENAPSYFFVPFHFNVGGIKDDEILIKVNGVSICKIRDHEPALIYLSSRDIVEIDAEKICRSYKVTIDSEPSHFYPNGYFNEFNIHNGLYRLSPLK